MAKKKSAAKAPTRKERRKLDTVFPCPICGANGSVTASFDRDKGIGSVECSECHNKFQVDNISILDEPIDVYAQWIDACESINE